VVQISTGGGWGARWSPAGHEIFYIADGKVMAVSVTPRGDSLDPGVPRALFPIPEDRAGASFEPDPKGERFLIPILVEGRKPNEIEVISTWPR
jgi:hypothetical protein